ncbi:hypothetical protein [Pseudodesulfovibrio karagichevae]|uniref:SpoIIAA-like n=1 Tax=Pseudodesulfovibrio karagichevae TaxID=3239305 RepID=A0ABV4JYV1_9BACT
MPFACEFEEMDGFLQCVVRGSIRNSRELTEYAETILAKAERVGTRRILLQEKALDTSLSAFDAVVLVKNLDKLLGPGPRRRIALVHAPDNEAAIRSFETVFRNRGYRHRMFLDEEAASRWLMG